MFEKFNTLVRGSISASIIALFVLVQLPVAASAQQRVMTENPTAKQRGAVPADARTRTTRSAGTESKTAINSGLPCTNVIVDGNLEATGNPAWTQASTSFGTPMCTLALCGDGQGSAGPRSGNQWAWLGGAGSAAETASIAQTVTIASGSTATLRYHLWIGSVSTPFTDVLNIRVDGNIVQTVPEPDTAGTAYTERTVDLTAFANGGSHTIMFEYVGPGGSNSNYNLDDISLDVCEASSSNASISGRVIDQSGRGVGGAYVYLTEDDDTIHVAVTNPFGYYTIGSIPTGQTVGVAVAAKRHSFTSQNVSVTGDLTNVNFTSN